MYLRRSSVLWPKLQNFKPNQNHVQARNQSSSSGKSGSSRVGLFSFGLVAGVGALGGGTIGYASVNNEFRKQVETNVPGSKEVFDFVLGKPDSISKPKQSQISEPIAPPSKLRQRSSSSPSASLPPAPPFPPIEPPKQMETDLPKTEEEERARRPRKKIAKEKEEPKKLEEKEEPKKVEEKEEAKKIEEKEETKKDDNIAHLELAIPDVTAQVKTNRKHERKDNEKEEEEEDKDNKETKEGNLEKNLKSFDYEEERAVMLDKAIHRRVAAIKEELEMEMRVQLRRQAEAHSDHLNDALSVQEQELERQHRRVLCEALHNSAIQHHEEMHGLVGHVQGIRQALETRSRMDLAAVEAQELWLACSALQQALETTEDPVVLLDKEISMLNKVLDNNADSYVKAVMEALPETGTGVASETTIRERFLRVERLARRTALIGDDGGSLFKYVLSYLQSFLIIGPNSSREIMPDKHEEVDLDTLGVHDIVWLAKGCLDRGDLDQAVKYMSLLRGEPKNVSSDWIKEARLLLETKQACRALLAHAAGIGAEALPQRKH